MKLSLLLACVSFTCAAQAPINIRDLNAGPTSVLNGATATITQPTQQLYFTLARNDDKQYSTVHWGITVNGQPLASGDQPFISGIYGINIIVSNTYAFAARNVFEVTSSEPGYTAQRGVFTVLYNAPLAVGSAKTSALPVVSTEYYDFAGRKLPSNGQKLGLVIVVETLSDGRLRSQKVFYAY